MRQELQKKIDNAIKLLQTISRGKDGEVIEVAYSGGKDSDVILQLVREANIPYRAIYKNTTIDPPGTIKHVKEMGVEIMQPKMSFFHMIEKKGFPSMFTRFCCEVLKEYKVLDTCIIGIRREESRKRAERYKEPTVCRIYRKGGHVEQVLPILEWTLQDVQEFIEDRKIKLAPVYYRPDGTIDYTRRLGCVCCPLSSLQKVEFLKHPKMVRAWCRAGQKFLDTHPNSNSVKIFSDVYEMFAARVFNRNKSLRGFVLNKEAIFKTNYKESLEWFFNIKL